jgi:hypothetical protein
MKNVIVQLRIHRGKVTYDEHGNLTSDNQLMKLKYGVLEWVNFVKTARLLGYSKVELVKVTDGNDNYKEIEAPQEIIDSVRDVLAAPKAELTPEQKEIQELKELVAKLASDSKPEKKEAKKKPAKDSTPDINEELEAAREEYHKVLGKKPNHLMKLANLNKAISEKLAE